jgi:hypothetical protein
METKGEKKLDQTRRQEYKVLSSNDIITKKKKITFMWSDHKAESTINTMER